MKKGLLYGIVFSVAAILIVVSQKTVLFLQMLLDKHTLPERQRMPILTEMVKPRQFRLKKHMDTIDTETSIYQNGNW